MQEGESCTDKMIRRSMKKLSLIDTHCDTASELYHKGQSLYQNTCHISLEKTDKYENYTQFYAIWADKRKSDNECFDEFLKISDSLFEKIKNEGDTVTHVKTFDDMENAWKNKKKAIFLAVEDARILGGDINRLEVLHSRGVKYLTLLWGGETCIGASHDSEGGLTPFGREVVKGCFEYGIIPDLSHANIRVTDEVIDMSYASGKTVMASHSNCKSIYDHTRNLSDEHIKAIAELGGAIGLNLCKFHLCDAENEPCTVDTLISHIEGFIALGALDSLGLGCDMDGAPLPDGISGVGDLDKLALAMKNKGYSDEVIEKIFYKNHYNFLKNNF